MAKRNNYVGALWLACKLLAVEGRIMQESVKQDRHLWVGGSDIPIILEISPFKKRFDLLLEKAQVSEQKEFTSPQIEYGNVMEEKIRNHINKGKRNKYVENKVELNYYDVPVRYHADGFNGKCVLEVKTTSQIYGDLNGYKKYLVQLLFGMWVNKVDKGLLAVYERPEDYSEEFDESRLQLFEIKMKDHQELLEQILDEVKRFWLVDLPRVKENSFITEQELKPQLPKELADNMNALELIEEQMKGFEELQEQYEKIKKAIYNGMYEHSIKNWTLPSGMKITLVLPTEDTTKIVDKFNLEMFKNDYPDLYSAYMGKEEKVTKGKKGYIRIYVE